MNIEKYPKIQTLFMRDDKGIIIPSKYTTEEFKYLNKNEWECTEKIDGTNIRIIYDKNNEAVEFKGRTNQAIIPKHLLTYLVNTFTVEKFKTHFGADCPSTILFGEGHGFKIQFSNNYYYQQKDKIEFILFDVAVGKWWLDRRNVEDVAIDFQIPVVPLMGYMTIPEAIAFTEKGFKSVISELSNNSEGLVLKTPQGLLMRNGERLITKLKTMDFVKYRNSLS